MTTFTWEMRSQSTAYLRRGCGHIYKVKPSISNTHRKTNTIGSHTRTKNPPPRLRPCPVAHRSGTSLGARERGLTRAAWAGGATYPQPSMRATTPGCGKKSKFNGQVRNFVSCPFVPLCTKATWLSLLGATSFVPFLQPTSNASYKVSFLVFSISFFRCGSSLDLLYVYMFMIK